jgi:hypothetical protein
MDGTTYRSGDGGGDAWRVLVRHSGADLAVLEHIVHGLDSVLGHASERANQPCRVAWAVYIYGM